MAPLGHENVRCGGSDCVCELNPHSTSHDVSRLADLQSPIQPFDTATGSTATLDNALARAQVTRRLHNLEAQVQHLSALLSQKVAPSTQARLYWPAHEHPENNVTPSTNEIFEGHFVQPVTDHSDLDAILNNATARLSDVGYEVGNFRVNDNSLGLATTQPGDPDANNFGFDFFGYNFLDVAPFSGPADNTLGDEHQASASNTAAASEQFIDSAALDWLDFLSEDANSFNLQRDQSVGLEASLAGSTPRLPQATSQSTRRFACSVAGCNVNSFKRKADLERHHASKHQPGRFPCPYPTCDRVGNRAFARSDKLMAHQRAKNH